MRYHPFSGVNAGVLSVPEDPARFLLQPACNPLATERDVRQWRSAVLAGTARQNGGLRDEVAPATSAGTRAGCLPGLLAGRLQAALPAQVVALGMTWELDRQMESGHSPRDRLLR